MLDLSFITGAAPATGPAGRVPQGTGPAERAGETAFVDALATLAAFTGTASDDAVAGDAGESTPLDAWLDPPADGSDAQHAIDATAVAGAFVPVSPELPAHDTAVAPGEHTGVQGQTSSATHPHAAAVATAPTPGVPGESAATTTASTTAFGAKTVDAPADASAGQPGTPSVEADSTSDAASENDGAVFKHAADRGDQLDARAAGQRRAHAAAMTSSPAADASRAGAVDAAARANRVTDGAMHTVAPDTSASTPASGPAPSSLPASAESLSPAIGSSTGQRSSSDAGDASAGFAFGGQMGARLAAPAPAVSASTFASLVNASSTPDALPAETTTQIVQSIRLQMLRDGGEAHIRLDPRQFGDMTVRVKVEQGQVIARVEADAPVVREWLQSNQHVLRQSLASQQLTLDRLEVHEPPASDRERRDGESDRGGQQGQPRQPRRQRPETGESFEVVA